MSKKAHFIGICGVGMAATATLLKEKGYEITGSDQSCHPPISDYIKKKGIPYAEGYKASNIPEKVELVVAGGSAKLDPSQNEEVFSAHERKIPVKTFPQVLGELSEGKQNVLAVGSYGKSTMASLLAWCLHHAGKDPNYFIGAIPLDFPAPASLGKSELFVMEGDEYPTSGIDKTSKFLYLNPHSVVLTSAEHDHVNVFPTVEDYLEPFKELLSKIPSEGSLVACLDNPNVSDLLSECRAEIFTYGLNQENNPLWSASNIVYGEVSSFNLLRGVEVVAKIQTKLLGRHNIQNIVGAAAFLVENKFITPEEFVKAIASFSGITRRLDKKTEKSKVLVYEGFGSSYDKARAAIDAMKAHFPQKRLITVFEPHSFSWRNRDKMHWYDDAFLGSDLVFVYQPASIGALSHAQLSHEEIVEYVSKSHSDSLVKAIQSEEEGLSELKKALKENDVVLLLTSGNLDGLVQSIPKMAEEVFPN